MSATPLTVLIVGNGVAGPVLAMALQKISKHKVILVDAGPEEVQPIGAAVAIAPNGLNALKFIEADYIVTEKGGMMEQMTIGHGETNTRLVNEKIAEQFTEKYGFASYAVKREDLCRGLRELAKKRNIDIRYNLSLKSIEQVDNTVTATFANEETLNGDLLIGCDGIHSTTRTFVVGKDTKPDFAGVSVILGLGTLTPEEEAAAGLVQGFNMWLGAGTMFGAVKCDPHGTWACITGFQSKDPAGGETEWNKGDHSVEQFTKIIERKTEGWSLPIPGILVPKLSRAFPLGIYDREPIPSWHKGRVVLVGDAAHPVTPFGGQGAQMAMESSIILARLLADNNPSDELFQRYHDLRRGRTGATTSFRRRVGIMLYATIWEFIRNLLVRLVAGYFIRSGFMGHYAYDVGTAPLTP